MDDDRFDRLARTIGDSSRRQFLGGALSALFGFSSLTASAMARKHGDSGRRRSTRNSRREGDRRSTGSRPGGDNGKSDRVGQTPTEKRDTRRGNGSGRPAQRRRVSAEAVTGRKVIVFISGVCSREVDPLFNPLWNYLQDSTIFGDSVAGASRQAQGLRVKAKKQGGKKGKKGKKGKNKGKGGQGSRPVDYGYSAATDFLYFSYDPGDPEGGEAVCFAGLPDWNQNPYEKTDPAATPIQESVERLHNMLVSYRLLEPRASFVLVGHSLGGVIAFNEIVRAPKPSANEPRFLDAVITIDSPLHGVEYPQPLINFAADRGLEECFARGDAIEALASMGNSPAVTRNVVKDIANAAADKDIRLVTMGNEVDCLYHPISCLGCALCVAGDCDLCPNFASTQWTAEGGAKEIRKSFARTDLLKNRAECLKPSEPFKCVDARHAAFLEEPEGVKAIAEQIGKQIAGAPVPTCSCPTGQTECVGTCTDTATNPNHCGRCGNRCSSDQDCVNGECLPPIKLRIEASVQDPVTGKPLSAPPSAVLPANATISAEITLTKANSQPIVRTVQVTHDDQSYSYSGILDLGTGMPEGQYAVAVKFRDRVRTLREQAPGLITLERGATASARVVLTPGDANDDNALTSADCDLIASCYTFPGFPAPCSGDTLKAADITDDGVVDEFDVNLCSRSSTAATCKALDQSCSRTSDCCAKSAVFQMELVCQQGRCVKASAPTTTYQFVKAWWQTGDSTGEFFATDGVAVDGDGTVYVTDWNRIQKFSTSGAFLGQWGSFGNGDSFYFPHALAFDGDGNAYVADTESGRIVKLSAGGALLTEWDVRYPTGVAVSQTGIVYVVDAYNVRVEKFTTTGAPAGQWDVPGCGGGTYASPTGAAVDATGSVYVTNSACVQKFTAAGALVKEWGAGFGDGEGELVNPEAVTVDGAGNVYVADTGNDRIQKFAPGGALLAAWGSEGSGDGQFKSPRGVAVDGNGNVYVADTGNGRIQKFAPVGAGRAMPKTAGTVAAEKRNARHAAGRKDPAPRRRGRLRQGANDGPRRPEHQSDRKRKR